MVRLSAIQPVFIGAYLRCFSPIRLRESVAVFVLRLWSFCPLTFGWLYVSCSAFLYLGLHKWWKAHEKINGQVIEHISPYQQKVVSTLFKHPLQSIKSKAMGIWPAFPVFGGMFYFMHWAKETHHHNARAEWP